MAQIEERKSETMLNTSNIGRALRVEVLALSLILTACSGGALRGFRVGLNVTLPFVAQLVTEGVISQTVASAVTTDVSDGIDAAVICDKCLKAIPSEITGKSRQLAKSKCYVSLAINLRAILDRHNIGGAEQLDRIARIINAGILAFEEYARDIDAPEATIKAGVKRGSARTAEAASEPVGDPDKKLKEAIRKFKDELREATKSTSKGYLFPRNDRFLVVD